MTCVCLPPFAYVAAFSKRQTESLRGIYCHCLETTFPSNKNGAAGFEFVAFQLFGLLSSVNTKSCFLCRWFSSSSVLDMFVIYSFVYSPGRDLLLVPGALLSCESETEVFLWIYPLFHDPFFLISASFICNSITIIIFTIRLWVLCMSPTDRSTPRVSLSYLLSPY